MAYFTCRLHATYIFPAYDVRDNDQPFNQLTAIFAIVIDSALTDAAMEGRERFSFTWLRSQSKLFLAMPGRNSNFCDSPRAGKKGEEATRPPLESSDFACLDRWGVQYRFSM